MILGKHVSPALFILPFPLLFRATCYYYRKAYYRAFFWDPPACAVSEVAPRKNYTGEREFPFILQNLHRYAFYLPRSCRRDPLVGYVPGVSIFDGNSASASAH